MNKKHRVYVVRWHVRDKNCSVIESGYTTVLADDKEQAITVVYRELEVKHPDTNVYVTSYEYTEYPADMYDVARRCADISA